MNCLSAWFLKHRVCKKLFSYLFVGNLWISLLEKICMNRIHFHVMQVSFLLSISTLPFYLLPLIFPRMSLFVSVSWIHKKWIRIDGQFIRVPFGEQDPLSILIPRVSVTYIFVNKNEKRRYNLNVSWYLSVNFLDNPFPSVSVFVRTMCIKVLIVVIIVVLNCICICLCINGCLSYWSYTLPWYCVTQPKNIL